MGWWWFLTCLGVYCEGAGESRGDERLLNRKDRGGELDGFCAARMIWVKERRPVSSTFGWEGALS